MCKEPMMMLQMWICLVLNRSQYQHLKHHQKLAVSVMCLACLFSAHFHHPQHLIKKQLTYRYCLIQSGTRWVLYIR